MPLVVERGGVTTRCTGNGYTRAEEVSSPNGTGHLEIALINNMPDAAVEDTEMQFLGLLGSASQRISIHAKLYSIPTVPRSERTKFYLDVNYSKIAELLSRRFDGVVITGTEPKQANLRQEPYWDALTEVFDWAEENTSSAVLSCLAAHAGVLHSDGISRCPLGTKRFGVFDQYRGTPHPLTEGVVEPIPIPHSRWNDLREDNLVSFGYQILTKSRQAGVDLFVKQKKQSLFVHFQGHPEYGEHTLLKEYRRDVKRYLRQERDNYPLAPLGYFDEEAEKRLERFRKHAVANRREEIIESFPESDVAYSLQNRWRESSTRIYKNWFHHLLAKKAEKPVSVVMAKVGGR